MHQSNSALLSPAQVMLRDPFWQAENNLIRRTVIPYQWEALNDRVEGAAPSWWMHNMRAAARAVARKKAGLPYTPRACTDRMHVEDPSPGQAQADCFYGWVFQDSDGYKWLEAVSYQLMLQPDPVLQAQAQQAVDAVCAAQEADGYLNTYYTLHGRERAFTNLRDHHELYCFGHLVEAAVAWHQATGREDLLRAACRFAEYIDSRFGPGRQRGCPGHEIAEMALFRLYEETGDDRWRALATFFLDVRGVYPSTFAEEENRRNALEGKPPVSLSPDHYVYWQANVPVRDSREAVGHAVRQMYLCCGMADAARCNRDTAMLHACERLWQSVVQQKMYVTGGVGGTHVGEAFSRPFDLPSDTAYSETCAAIGLVFFARRMLQLDPDSAVADVMELALYNTVLAGIALDGKHFFYVNPLEVDPIACQSDARLSHVQPERQKWFGCACCPPNLARLVSSLGSYIATVQENALYIHLYIGCEMRAALAGQPLVLQLDANLTASDQICLRVTEGKGTGTVALRIPGWAEGAVLHAPGKEVAVQKGYWVIKGCFSQGDVIQASLPMPIRVLGAHPRVRETAGQVCFARGPFVYCAEEKDNGKDLHLLRAVPDAPCRPGLTTIAGREIPVIDTTALRLDGEDGPLYRPWEAEKGQTVPLRLIPYFAWNNRGRGEMRVWLQRA